jgi:hypothetical protein
MVLTRSIGANRLLPIPIALNLQPVFIKTAAAITLTDRLIIIILKRLLHHAASSPTFQ